MELVDNTSHIREDRKKELNKEFSGIEAIKEEKLARENSIENFSGQERSSELPARCPLLERSYSRSGTAEKVINPDNINKLIELLTNIDNIIKQHDQQINRLEEDNKQTMLRYQKLESDYRSVQRENRQMRELLRRQGHRVAERVSTVEQGQKRLEEMNIRTLSEIETDIRRRKIHPGEPSIVNLVNGVEWTVEEIQSLLDEQKDLWGPCFYLRDYKFQVNIATNVRNGYLAFYVALVKGIHDDELEWPFRGEIIYVLRNQEKEDEYLRKEFVITSTQANENFTKPKEMRNTPIGFPKFIKIETLREDKYSKDDCIKITLMINPIT
ncbi:TNF receptor-associated factor 4 [Oopsacas minuta]|uniref:TNF receptor-associated factor 4 n=1 Tax=Oopsacas minuta TaxID=111878 RepID=A0AAV7KJ33_9METZ|nr:TNF receptor-associated factor 4 [Oopsacas minuta]